jgi:alkylated DNA repair protein alkB family protein 6
MDHVHETILKPLNLPRPNHALVNAYEPGEGIMAHEDGPAYTPYATVLSVGSSCVFDFLSKTREKAAQIYLPVGSLLLFTDDAYKHYMHEVRSEKFDSLCPDVLNTENIDPARLGDSVIRSADNVLVRGFRVSITMRHVPIAL